MTLSYELESVYAILFNLICALDFRKVRRNEISTSIKMKTLSWGSALNLANPFPYFEIVSEGGDGGAAHVIVLKESGGGGGGGGGHGGNGGGHSGGTVHVVHETFPSSGAWNADSGNVGANSWGAAGGAWNTGGSAPAGHGSASWGRRSQDSSKVLLNTSK